MIFSRIKNIKTLILTMGDKMKIKNSIMNSLWLIGLGVGGTILYQQIKNGNLKKAVYEMDRAKMKMIDDLEDII